MSFLQAPMDLIVWRYGVKLYSIIACALLLLSTTPALAELDPDQQKLVDRYSRILQKNRDAKERRTAARYLGRIKEPEVVAPLAAALSDSDAGVRRQAADALWRVGEVAAPAMEALRGVLDDPSPGVRVRAASALEMLGVPEAELVDARVGGLEADWLGDRILAARDLIGFVPGPDLVPPVAEVAAAEADSPSYDLGDRYLDPVKVIERMVRSGATDFIEPILVEVRAGNPGRRWLLKGLAALEPKPADWNAVLVAQLDSTRKEDRQVALDLLRGRVTEETGVGEWIQPVITTLDDAEVRDYAIRALERAKGYAAAAAEPLSQIVASDADADNRERAVEALAAIGDRSQAFPSDDLRQVAVTALPAICKAAVEDVDKDVRHASVRTLGTLRVSADEVLPTLLAVAKNDDHAQTRFSALLRIRDLGTDAQSAIPELEEIVATEEVHRATAEQALEFVKTRPPDFTLEVTTATTATAGSGAALSRLREQGIDYTIHQFMLALSDVQTDRVELFLDAGMSPNERVDDVGLRPLHTLYHGFKGCTVQTRPTPEGTKEITRMLLERGADPNAVDDRGNSILKFAALECDADVVRLLIEAGADVNAVDQNGMAPFELTLWSGTDAADALIEAGYRLPADKAASYREAYKDNPKAQELIDRATE
jgi:HEAT repeat protein